MHYIWAIFFFFSNLLIMNTRKRADYLMTERVRLETYLMQVTFLDTFRYSNFISTSLWSEIGQTTIYSTIRNMLVKFSMLLQETL